MYLEIINHYLKSLKESGQYREFATINRICGQYPLARLNGRDDVPPVVVWCSNDYLGMSQHPAVTEAMHHAIRLYGAGSGGSRNIGGTHCDYNLLESSLAEWHGKEAALVFPTGYGSNDATLQCLLRLFPNCFVCSDEHNHASIINGIRSAKAERAIFKHNDVDHLEELLAAQPRVRAKMIVFESVYSMDGDISPIEKIVELAGKYNDSQTSVPEARIRRFGRRALVKGIVMTKAEGKSMNVLIAGLGYAGTRFLQAFSYVNENRPGNEKINIAYVNRNPKRNDIRYFQDIETAVGQFCPDVIVVSVNDEFHMDVIKRLNGFKGFIVCEKPLANTRDDLEAVEAKLSGASGFCLNLIERYSDAAIALKEYVEKHGLRLIRANFYWGKDRINDHRPTCGVISEIIHPLDLVQWVCAPDSDLKLKDMIGVRSDFSVSGGEVLDSVAVTACLDGAAVTGYSSFVNIVRKREVDLVFASPQNRLVFASMVFDTPAWDIDHLRIWERTSAGEHVITDVRTEIDDAHPGLKTIRKLVRLADDVVGYVSNGKAPSRPFPCLKTALRLQRMLNAIERDVRTVGPVQYVVGPEREFYNDRNDWERLG